MEIEIQSEETAERKSKLAQFISYCLHPLLMPTYGFALIFFTRNYISTFTPPEIRWRILLVTFVFTFFLPALNALLLLRTGRIQSLEMKTTNERTIPYLSTIMYYVALFYLLYNAQFPNIFRILILGAAISILIVFLVNFKWKISAHTVGIGGITGAVLGIIYRLQIDLQFMLIFLILLSGIAAYARLKLQAHNPAQVYTGFVVGFAVELLLMLFY